MSVNRPLEIDSNGNLKEVVPTTVSTGVAEANTLVELDATGKLDPSLLPTGTGADVTVVPATVALSAGDFVNLYDNGGTVEARLADASDISTKADGFVLAAVAPAGNASVYRRGSNNVLAGLTLGAQYFLDASTPGGLTTTPPSGNLEIVQPLGVADSATSLDFERVRPVIKMV